MEYLLEVPDDEAAFIVEVIRRLSASVKLTPTRKAESAGPSDDTAHLMSSPANHTRLSASLNRIKRGEYTERVLLPDAE